MRDNETAVMFLNISFCCRCNAVYDCFIIKFVCTMTHLAELSFNNFSFGCYFLCLCFLTHICVFSCFMFNTYFMCIHGK